MRPTSDGMGTLDLNTIALVDHYDSFTFNVRDWLEQLPGVVVEHGYYDDSGFVAAIRDANIPLVFSPGPREPSDARPSIALAREKLGRVPILGICLGHQILAVATGSRLVKASAPVHGACIKLAWVAENSTIFRGLGAQLSPASYNSLVVDARTLASCWRICAVDAWGQVQAIEWRGEQATCPAIGLQFHPESFLSEGAEALLGNWWSLICESAESQCVAPYRGQESSGESSGLAPHDR